MAPRFKKLTDCPENLREAIDWLIQVRHGSGEGGKGLENLSQALKKLIGENVKKAYNSILDMYAKSLDPSWKTKECCKVKFAAIEQLQNQFKESKIFDFNSLNDHLSKLKYDKNICEKHHYVDSSKDTPLKDIDAKLKHINELSENLNGFTKEPKAILENLCTGLETFLGFNPESKGYTGEGIVYSDLDRLCDAVMAFLHRVLESVKDDDAVKTYFSITDSHIKHLKGFMYSGQHKFSLGVDAVKAILSYHQSELDKRVNAVVNDKTGQLKALQAIIVTNIREVEKLNDLGVTSFGEIASKWYDTVTNGLSIWVKNAELAISDLDDPLKKNVMNILEKIRAQISNVNDSTIRDVKHLKEFSTNVANELRKLERHVRGEVGHHVEAYKEELILEFHTINEEINLVNAKLKEHVDALNRWTQNAENLVEKAIPQIKDILDVIENKDKENRQYPNQITIAATMMQAKADSLRLAVEEAKQFLTPLVNTIKRNVAALESAYTNTLRDLQSTVQRQVVAAQGKLGELHNKVGQDLVSETFQQPIKNEIKKVIAAFQDAIRRVGGAGDSGNAASLIQEFSYQADREAAPNMYDWVDKAKGSSLDGPLVTLQSSFSSNHFGSFTAFLKTFPDLKANIRGNEITLFDAIISDLETKIKDAINKIKRQLGTHMKNYNNYAKDEENGEIRDAIEQVKTSVDGYFEGKDTGVLTAAKLKQYGFKDHEGNGKKKDLEDEIEKIEKAGLHPFVQFERRDSNPNHIDDSTFKTLKSTITSNLETLIRIIREQANDSSGVLQKIKVLKDTYFGTDKNVSGSIKELHDKLSTLLSHHIGSLIIKTKRFLNHTIPQNYTKCINAITKQLNMHITQAIRDIKKDSLDRYVTSKTAELKSLKTFIEEQRRSIERIMRIDGHTGVKGLLKILRSQFGSALQISGRTNIGEFFVNVQDFLAEVWKYVGGQLTNNGNAVVDSFVNVKEKIETLFTDVTHFNNQFRNNLNDVSNALSTLKPENFGGQSSPLLDVFKVGCESLIGELKKAYIRVYDGSKPITWEEPFSKNTTEESRNAAKVFLTIMTILFNNLNEVKEMCNSSSASRINIRTELGEFLMTCGYNVSDKGLQNGELQDKDSMQGSHIYKLLVGDGQNVYHVDKAAKRALEMIYEDCLVNYYRTCHLPTPATKHPSTICDILQWFAGLPYNAVYNALSHDAFSDLFEKPEKEHNTDNDTLVVSINEDPDSLPAYPETISATGLALTLTDVCHHAEETLIAILGHGHSDGRYACDFNTNAGKFLYPSKASQCLDLLVEVLLRLYDQLYFLHVQCYRTSDSVSWRDCYYGRYVAGSDWRCNDKQCVNKMGNQMGGQTADQHPKCGLKSPLQSFLEDGLPGFLPHPYKKADCKLSCAAPNHRGLPCKTPMGFADLSVKASHTKTGEYLSNVLSEFCGDAEKPLTKMCRLLICVLNRPPQTLGDMFSFYYNLLNGWNRKGKGMDADKKHKRQAFEAAVTNAYFGVNYPTFDVGSVINNSKEPSEKHKDGNLLCLVGCKNSSVPSAQCGRYLQPFGINTWLAFSSENADKYLSWIVYITETFYDLLKKLYDECCNNCNKPGRRCYKSCVKNCVASHSYIHSAGCTSIAQCPFTRPTLSKYGFVLRSISNLHGATDIKTKRTCKDLCNALKNVLNEKNVLFTLAYRTIPQFLYDIRQPFIWLNVALWLLSLLYLLHIMVIRLDLLHIKSHLHSPSSHRIAAQSLLAAARVGKLAKLSYLQA